MLALIKFEYIEFIVLHFNWSFFRNYYLGKSHVKKITEKQELIVSLSNNKTILLLLLYLVMR